MIDPPSKPSKKFGEREPAPPVVTHAPLGLPGGPQARSPRQMRSGAIVLGMFGAVSLGIFALAEALNHRDCPADGQNDANNGACNAAGSSYHASGSGSRSAESESHSSGHEVSFGGFGGHGEGGGHGGGE